MGQGFAIQNKLEDAGLEVLERLLRCQIKGNPVENLKSAAGLQILQLLVAANKILRDFSEVAFG